MGKMVIIESTEQTGAARCSVFPYSLPYLNPGSEKKIETHGNIPSGYPSIWMYLFPSKLGVLNVRQKLINLDFIYI